MIIKSLLVWLSIIPLAILNGGLREMVINPLIGAKYGLPLSSISLCILIFLVYYFAIPRIGKGTARTYWIIGLLWIALTILFEFGMGLFMGNTLQEMVKAYDISTGNLWLLVVLFTGIAPWLTAKVRNLI